MAELTTSQLIKILLGIFVVVVVVLGIFLFFRGTVIDFFKNLPGADEEPEENFTLGGESDEEEEAEEVPAPTFEYGSKTYTVVSSTRIERSDGRVYILEGDIWGYQGPSSEEEGYVTPASEGSQESYDRWISKVNQAISGLSEEPFDEEEGIEPPRLCEDCKSWFLDTCSEEECINEISRGLIRFNQHCQFIPKNNLFGTNRCITINN